MKRRTAFPEKLSFDPHPDESCPLRWIFIRAGLLALVGIMLASQPATFAQTNNPPGTAQPPVAATAPALSHDLSGVWMPYSTHMDGIDEKLRPPLTPWGQARFDASAPLVGPRAVAGKENNPALHCEPEAVPKSLILPNPFEIVQIPGRMFMLFRAVPPLAHRLGGRASASPMIPIPIFWVTRLASGRATLLWSKRLA